MNDQAVQYKDQLYGELVRIGKGLASDKRLEILDLLSQSPKAVDKIALETGISVANTSRHLQVLKDSRLVKTEKHGNHIIYRLGSAKIVQLVRLLIQVGECELSEMQVIEQTADRDVPTISLTDAMQEQGKSLILDVRPEDEYAAGHIDNAVNIPLTELPTRYDQLPKDRQIIVYCRGRLCANSNQATQHLTSHGFHAVSLNSSYRDWQDQQH
jgi:rhodanese-related sulfurtransferase/DNA-binding transcriptional ArsR family regulator